MSNVSGSNVDEIVECPLCMEPLEVDDLNFFPCTCGYQICRFCWHRIRTDENELCPACRKEYPENPADFKPLSQEEMIAFKFQKRQRDQQRKQKITENRKHLANVRVVQKNLVFVVGLPPRLADAEILRKHEYFGKYGKIHKVVINPSTAYAGVQGPSASAYVTYVLNTDALRAIHSVNNIMIDGRLIKTSLGTTKYCSHFMKNQQCPKSDCMYLHELGDPEASFTKEEMHQGKHQEYEKRLHDLLVAATYISGPNANITSVVGTSISNNSCNNSDNKCSEVISSSSANVSMSSNNLENNLSSPITVSGPQKEAWPCLSLSPVCQKDPILSVGNKRIKERYKQDKAKHDKNSKSKSKNNVCHSNAMAATVFKDVDTNVDREKSYFSDFAVEKSRIEINKDNNCNVTSNFMIKQKDDSIGTGNKINNDTSEASPNSDDNKIISASHDETMSRNTETTPLIDLQSTQIPSNVFNVEDQATSIDISKQFDESIEISTIPLIVRKGDAKSPRDILKMPFKINRNDGIEVRNTLTNSDKLTDTSAYPDRLVLKDNNLHPLRNDTLQETLNRKIVDATVQNQISGRNVPNLPDLINGIDGYQNNVTCANDWENAFKNVVLKPTKQMESSFQQQHIQHQLEGNSQMKQFEDLRRLQDFQRRNAFLNSISASDINLARNGTEIIGHPHYMEQQSELLQQQVTLKSSERTIQTTSFETNMSKFFDFHKHQQQKMQMQNVLNGANSVCGGLSENFHMMSLLENKLQSQMLDHNSPMSSQPQNLQNAKHCGKVDQMICYHQLPPTQGNHTISSIQQNQLKNHYMQNSSADDDLGFDPFIETQKALAELIENEEEQQNTTTSVQSKHTTRQLNNQMQAPIDQALDSALRFRFPQTGYNQANNLGGYNVSQGLQTNSKILPFVNISPNNMDSCNHPIQQHQIASNVWGSNMNNIQQYSSVPEIRREQFIQSGDNQKGYSGSDWTAMDPAILSFRQFSFPQHNQMGSQLQQPEQEIFLQQLSHHHQPTVFEQQSQHGGRSNIPNPVLNSHHNSQAQVAANVQGMLEYLKHRQCI